MMSVWLFCRLLDVGNKTRVVTESTMHRENVVGKLHRASTYLQNQKKYCFNIQELHWIFHDSHVCSNYSSQIRGMIEEFQVGLLSLIMHKLPDAISSSLQLSLSPFFGVFSVNCVFVIKKIQIKLDRMQRTTGGGDGICHKLELWI